MDKVDKLVWPIKIESYFCLGLLVKAKQTLVPPGANIRGYLEVLS